MPSKKKEGTLMSLYAYSVEFEVPWHRGLLAFVKICITLSAMWTAAVVVGNQRAILGQVTRKPMFYSTNPTAFAFPVCVESMEFFEQPESTNGSEMSLPAYRLLVITSEGDCTVADIAVKYACYKVFDAGSALPEVATDNSSWLPPDILTGVELKPEYEGGEYVVAFDYNYWIARSDSSSECLEAHSGWRGNATALWPNGELQQLPLHFGQLQDMDGNGQSITPSFPAVPWPLIVFVVLMATVTCPIVAWHLESGMHAIEKHGGEEWNTWTVTIPLSIACSFLQFVMISTQAELIGLEPVEGWPEGAAFSKGLAQDEISTLAGFCGYLAFTQMPAALLCGAASVLILASCCECLDCFIDCAFEGDKKERRDLQSQLGLFLTYYYAHTIIFGSIAYLVVWASGDLKLVVPDLSVAGVAGGLTWSFSEALALVFGAVMVFERVVTGSLCRTY